MNIEPAQNVANTNNKPQNTPSNNTKTGDTNFADELKSLKAPEEKKEETDTKSIKDADKKDEITTEKAISDKNKEVVAEEVNIEDTSVEESDNIIQDNMSPQNNINNSIAELSGALNEIKKLNYSEEKQEVKLKENEINDETDIMLDNDINIRERELINPQMNSSMSFNSNGQPFSDFMNGDSDNENLSSSAKEIAEEKAILSTMNDNYMMAKARSNQAEVMNTRNKASEPAITEEASTVIMSRADVDFFTSIVNKQELNINNIENVEKSSKVSKTLADMLVKAMNDNKPLRIDFDNNISVIIKISKDGKISADFLPSSQIAEAYLKENLPILRQKFDENNINYGELNQRKHKQDNDTKDNKKKGGKDE